MRIESSDWSIKDTNLVEMAIPVVDGQHKGQRSTYQDVADSDANDTSIDTVRLSPSDCRPVCGSLAKEKKLKEHIHLKKINRSQKWIER